MSFREFAGIRATYGGHQVVRSGVARHGFTTYMSSHPFLEWRVRTRLRAIDNVHFREGLDVVDLSTNPSRTRVSGVTVANRLKDGEPRWLAADLVIDATERGSRTPHFLKSIGYLPPDEQHV